MREISDYDPGEEDLFFEEYFKHVDIDTIVLLLADTIGNSPSLKRQLIEALEYRGLIKRK